MRRANTLQRTLLALVLCMLITEASAAQASAPASSQPTKLGRYRSTLTDLVEPSAAAIRGNEILVADSGNHRIVVFDREVRRLRTLGERGHCEGGLLRPAGVAVDHTGRIFIADTGNHRIVVLEPDGKPFATWGTRGRGNGEFCNPTAIAVQDERVAVVDSGNERVQLFNRAGKHLLTIAADDKTGASASAENRPRGATSDDLAAGSPAAGGAPLGQLGGVALAPDGAIYVSDITHHRILVFDATGKRRHAFGDWGAFPGQFAAPAGLALHGGDLFVADTMNHRIQALTPEGPTRYEWGLHVVDPRSGEGRLHYPRHVAVSPDGAIAVVCEPFEDRCQVFVRTAMTDRTVGRLIPGNEGTAAHFGPRADVSGDYLALTEPESHSLMLYDCRGPVPINITQIGGYGERFDQFNTPADVKLDAAAARLYALDTGNRRLQMFTLKFPKELGFSPMVGSFAKAWSFEALHRAASKAQLEWPLCADAIERDREGNFYLLDSRNCTVLKFDQKLNYLRQFGMYAAASSSGAMLQRPVDLCVSLDGERIFVADADRACVVVLSASGRHGGTAIGGPAGSPGALVEPAGVALGPDGTLYVADRGAHRIVCFNADGRFVRAWGTQGLGAGQFFKPTGVQVDARGRVLVLDYGNHRGQYFDAAGDYISAFGARFYVAPARRSASQPK